MERGRGLFFLLFSLIFRACFLFLQITKKTFPYNGVRSWLAYPESLHFQVFSLFLICHDCTRCTEKSIRSQEDKKKKIPLQFLICRDRTRCTAKSIRSQGRQQSETKKKYLIIKLTRYERFKKKQIRHCNIIPSDSPKWVFLEQTEMVLYETKTISQWKWHSRCNGIDPMGHNCIENLKPKTLSNFWQHQYQVLIKTESSSS